MKTHDTIHAHGPSETELSEKIILSSASSSLVPWCFEQAGTDE